MKNFQDLKNKASSGCELLTFNNNGSYCGSKFQYGGEILEKSENSEIIQMPFLEISRKVFVILYNFQRKNRTI